MSGQQLADGLTPCQHPGCTAGFQPKRKDSRYCPEHNTSKARSARERLGKRLTPAPKPRPTPKPKRATTAGKPRPATARRPAKRREEGLQPTAAGAQGLPFALNMILTTDTLVQLLRAAADRLEEEGV